MSASHPAATTASLTTTSQAKTASSNTLPTRVAQPLTINSSTLLPTGYEMPLLGYGVYQTPLAVTKSVVLHALRRGYRHFDTAHAYRNEEGVVEGILEGLYGEASNTPSNTPNLDAKSNSTTLTRDQIFYTTKIPPRAQSYTAAHKAITESIARLTPDASNPGRSLEYIDLLLLHAPYGGPVGRREVWHAAVEAVRQGHVRSLGVSNFGLDHLNEIDGVVRDLNPENDSTIELGARNRENIPISVHQIELHPFLPRREIVAWCRERGIILQAWAPLVRAQRMDDARLLALAAKHTDLLRARAASSGAQSTLAGKTHPDAEVHEDTQSAAVLRTVTPAQILLRWSLQQGFVPLPKSVTTSRIDENADLYDFELDEEDMRVLETDEYFTSSWDPSVSGIDN